MVPRSAEECRVVPGRGGADIGEPLNYSTTIPGRVNRPLCEAGLKISALSSRLLNRLLSDATK